MKTEKFFSDLHPHKMGTTRKRIEQGFQKCPSWPKKVNDRRDMGQKPCCGRRFECRFPTLLLDVGGWDFRRATPTSTTTSWCGACSSAVTGELQSKLGRELQWRRRERRKRKRRRKRRWCLARVWGKGICWVKSSLIGDFKFWKKILFNWLKEKVQFAP